MTKLISGARRAAESIVCDRRLVFYGLILLALHIMGIVLLYDAVPEFDIVPHFWFGYVLSEYSSKAANSMNLQSRLAATTLRQGRTILGVIEADFILRLLGFLLVGGLFWEWAELTFSHYFHRRPDSFFAFPVTLRNIDGFIDVSVGVVGAVIAFLVANRESRHGIKA